MRFDSALIVVSDIAQSKKFYCELLGLSLQHDFGENVVFKDAFSIHLASHYKGLINHNPAIAKPAYNMELYFEHDDLPALQKKLEQNMVKFVHKIHTQPWQQQVIRFYDPDHHIIEVGESLATTAKRLQSQGSSLAEIAQKMGVSTNYASDLLQ